MNIKQPTEDICETQVWSWVSQPKSARPGTKGSGRYSRPLSERDKLISRAFGQEVRRLRQAAKLSTYKLAELVGVSQPMIIYIETREVNLELRLMWDLAEALGVEPLHFAAICDRAVSLAWSARSKSQL